MSAALLVPQVLSGIQLSFHGAARARALSWYVATMSGGAVVGQVLGGAIVSADVFGTSWRPVFLVNVPIGVALLAAAPRILPTDVPEGSKHVDLRGVASLSAAVVLATLPLVIGREHHWPTWTWACLVATVPAVLVFVRTERHVAARGRRPLVDLDVLRRPVVSWGLAANAAATSTYFSMLFVLALYLQQGLGKSALYSGLALASWLAAFGLSGLLLRRLPARVQARAASSGMVLLAAAFASIATVVLAGQPGGALLMLLLGAGGLGLGLGFGELLRHITAAVPPRLASDVSGLVTTSSQLAGALGVATFGTAYLALVPGAGRQDAVHGFASVCLLFASCAALAALAAGRTRRSAARAEGQAA
jgi:predicted MFS family arabinose efflux permease